MKRILLPLIMLTCFLSSCDALHGKHVSADDVKQKNKEAFETTKTYVGQEAKEYQLKLKDKLHHLHQKYEAVKEDIKK